MNILIATVGISREIWCPNFFDEKLGDSWENQEGLQVCIL